MPTPTRERVNLKEQHADHYGHIRIQRASLPEREITYRNEHPHQAPSPVRAGTSVDNHPEHMPYTTTTTAQCVSPHNTNAGEEESIYPQRMPSSARRYNAQTIEPSRPGFSLQKFLLQCALVMALATLLAIVWFSFVLPTFQNWHDSITYGNPRTYQVDAPPVGHLSGHFIAMNNHGVIELVQIPANPDKQPLHMWILARYTGSTASTLPITNISFLDMNGGSVDVEVTVGGEEYILFGDGKGNLSLTPPQKG